MSCDIKKVSPGKIEHQLPLQGNLAMKKINIVDTEQSWKKIVSTKHELIHSLMVLSCFDIEEQTLMKRPILIYSNLA